MKVLATTDGSEYSRLALRNLGRFVPVPGTELLLLSVYPNPASGTYGLDPFYADYPAIAESLRTEAERQAAEAAAILSQQGFSPPRVIVSQGDAASEIIDLAERERADLIAVGSHGRTGLTRFLLGSVSTRVAIHARCSVLVLRETTKDSDVPKT